MSYPVADLLFDNSITFDRIIWLAAICANPGDQSNDSFADVFEFQWSDEEAKELIGITVTEFTEERRVSFEALSSYLVRKNVIGFLVKASTPVPTYESWGGYSSGFGHTFTRWFYTEDLADAAFLYRVVGWRKEIHEEAKKEVKP